MSPVFATAYLPSIEYFRLLSGFEQITIEQCEHFKKQTMRNRCFILSPNGVQCLSVPIIHHSGTKQAIKELKISYASPWQRLHWKTFSTAYNRSPFFEYYVDEFHHFYVDDKYKWLIDFNMEQLSWILKSIKKNTVVDKTNSFSVMSNDDYRFISNVKSTEAAVVKQFKTYNQVFVYKYGFMPNLSIIDLIFNTGGRSMDYLADSLD